MLTQSELWWCTEYAEEIHDVLRDKEYTRFVFEFKGPQMKWRMHVIQFMLKVAEYHKLARATIHLAIFFFDIFLDNHIIQLWRLHLVALSSIRIAAKIEESDFTISKIEALNASGDYQKEDYKILEKIMLNLFEWDLNLPTVSTFGTYFVEFAVDESDFARNKQSINNFAEFKENVQYEVMYFVDFSLCDTSVQHKFLPSKIAAMCVAAARLRKKIEPIWTENLEKITRYTWSCIEDDYQLLFDIKIYPSAQLEAEFKNSLILEARECNRYNQI